MDKRTALLLALGGGVALAVAFLSPLSPLVQRTATEGMEGLTWSPYAPKAHQARGGLYHPPLCGQGVTGLLQNGWDWIISPPSENTGAGNAGY